jgi:hypothetical protein
MWCTPMCPRPFQGNPTIRLLFDLLHRSFQRFRVLASGVCASPHIKLVFAEILKLQSILPLDPTVTYDLWCRSFRNFMYCNFCVPVQLQRVFKPCTCFPSLTIMRVHLPTQTDPKAPTLLVWSPLSLWPDATPVVV